MMKRPIFILGTRPEVIKLSLLIIAFKDRNLNPKVISTGQHRDLLPQAFSAFNISPDIDLELMNAVNDPVSYVNIICDGLSEHINKNNTSYIIVQGDTASSLAGAKIGQQLGIPVGHVEAGVRSHNLEEPWPEERFRREITQIATHHFAPTETNRKNLENERVSPNEIIVTGNTVIDAIRHHTPARVQTHEKTILLSVHRRENITTFASDMEKLLRHIVKRFSDYTFRVIEHPNPDAQRLLEKSFDGSTNVTRVTPMNYQKIIQTLQEVTLIVTDSGGFQEEAAELGIPIVVLREYTDRPESLNRGAFLAKRNIEVCVSAIENALHCTPAPNNPFGPAGASEKIADFVHSFLEKSA